jgi:hypothetical protein
MLQRFLRCRYYNAVSLSASDTDQMAMRPFFPANRHGLFIDAVSILATLFIYPYLLDSVGALFDGSFRDEGKAFDTLSALLLFALAARLFGLYLKRFPLQTHLERNGDETKFPVFFLFLNFGVIILNAAFVAVFLSAVAGSLGLVEVDMSGRPKDSLVLTFIGVGGMLAVCAAESVLVYRLTKPLTEREKEMRAERSWLFDIRGEWAADFGLFVYMMIWQVFYNVTAKMMMSPPENAPDTWEYRIFSGVFTLIVFVIFYVSPRTAFLIEDRKHLGTWLFIIGVYLASILRYW